MSSKYKTYRAPDAPVPAETWTWNMYGPGVENIGRDGAPELLPYPNPIRISCWSGLTA